MRGGPLGVLKAQEVGEAGAVKVKEGGDGTEGEGGSREEKIQEGGKKGRE